MGNFISKRKDGVYLNVRAHPSARRTRITGVVGDRLKIDVAAKPESGAANQALVEYLADLLNMPRNRIRIIRGDKSRNKSLFLDCEDAGAVQYRCNEIIDKEQK